MIIRNSNLRQNLFENRYKILAVIVAIILILCVICALNEMAKQSANQEKQANTISTSSYKPQETAVLGENVSQSIQEENTKIMDEFISLCNKKQIEKAYALLTDECKKEIFNSKLQNFEKDFIEKIFNGTKTYSMQSWINSKNPTYKVRILNDVMSTGKIGEVIEDYYTIVNEKGEYKLSINSYIGKEYINKQTTKDNITIEIISKDIYMDYEIYNMEIRKQYKS